MQTPIQERYQDTMIRKARERRQTQSIRSAHPRRMRRLAIFLILCGIGMLFPYWWQGTLP